MSKNRSTKLLYAYSRVSVVAFALGAAGLACSARAATPPSAPRPVSPLAPPTLDSKHLFALGMLETGNNDREIGGLGEVSRYQILPSVWRAYTNSQAYFRPEVSVQVAKSHWSFLATTFTQRTGRAPSDFDMYVLWNTGAGYYASKGFSAHRVAPTVKDRAQRFVNLVNRRDDFAMR